MKNQTDGTPVALVTGASRGIGRAIAIQLAREGWDLGVGYLGNQEGAAETRAAIEALGQRGELCRGDLSRPEGREAMIQVLKEKYDRVDALINNAAATAAVRADILEETEESFDGIVSANLKGPYFLTQAVARWMVEIRQRFPERRFHVVNISSVSEYTTSTNRGSYCIAKAATLMMTRLFADRLAEHDIRVNEIRPGIIATDMTAGVREKYDRLIAEGLTPIRRWGQPEDVARAVLALVSGTFDFTTGGVFDVDGGFSFRRL